MANTTHPSTDAAIVKGNNELALNLYAAIRNQSRNLFFSPYSIFSALAMVLAGARGETASQMATGLYLPLDHSHVHPGFAPLNNRLRGAGPAQAYQLKMANALWGAHGVGFRADFLETVQAAYGAKV